MCVARKTRGESKRDAAASVVDDNESMQIRRILFPHFHPPFQRFTSRVLMSESIERISCSISWTVKGRNSEQIRSEPCPCHSLSRTLFPLWRLLAAATFGYLRRQTIVGVSPLHSAPVAVVAVGDRGHGTSLRLESSCRVAVAALDPVCESVPANLCPFP